jgi:hypothetical protein
MMETQKVKKAERFVVDGLSETFEPSSKSIKNILAYSNAYRYDKSKSIGDVEYLIN